MPCFNLTRNCAKRKRQSLCPACHIDHLFTVSPKYLLAAVQLHFRGVLERSTTTMYIQIKTADASLSKRVEVSKLTSVEELKALVEDVLDVKPERQRLFFRGKQVHCYIITIKTISKPYF